LKTNFLFIKVFHSEKGKRCLKEGNDISETYAMKKVKYEKTKEQCDLSGISEKMQSTLSEFMPAEKREIFYSNFECVRNFPPAISAFD
jgi:hypothetical protein